MDVSKPECNIVHKTLSQNNSSDVQTNVITELKDNEHKEPSVTEKVTSHSENTRSEERRVFAMS